MAERAQRQPYPTDLSDNHYAKLQGLFRQALRAELYVVGRYA
jgi:hypothetical protein